VRLNDYTDYSLRVLMFCAANPERSVTIAELADHQVVSKNHLMKVVNDLARHGYLHTTRGRAGGLRLLKTWPMSPAWHRQARSRAASACP